MRHTPGLLYIASMQDFNDPTLLMSGGSDALRQLSELFEDFSNRQPQANLSLDSLAWIIPLGGTTVLVEMSNDTEGLRRVNLTEMAFVWYMSKEEAKRVADLIKAVAAQSSRVINILKSHPITLSSSCRKANTTTCRAS